MAPSAGDAGTLDGAVISGLGGQQALFGDDSWKWMLIGPVKSR